jgi:hypothetical protein
MKSRSRSFGRLSAAIPSQAFDDFSIGKDRANLSAHAGGGQLRSRNRDVAEAIVTTYLREPRIERDRNC